MTKKYEVFDFEICDQGMGIRFNRCYGIFTSLDEAVARIDRLLWKQNENVTVQKGGRLPEHMHAVDKFDYLYSDKSDPRACYAVTETEIQDKYTDDVNRHLWYNPWLHGIYKTAVDLEMSTAQFVLKPGPDDTALYYLADNLRKELGISRVPEDYFAFLKLVGGYSFSGKLSTPSQELFADNIITRSRPIHPAAVRGAVIEPKFDKTYIRLGYVGYDNEQQNGNDYSYIYLLYKHDDDSYHVGYNAADSNKSKITPMAGCNDMLVYFFGALSDSIDEYRRNGYLPWIEW